MAAAAASRCKPLATTGLAENVGRGSNVADEGGLSRGVATEPARGQTICKEGEWRHCLAV